MVLEINIEEDGAAAAIPKDPVGEKLREIRRVEKNPFRECFRTLIIHFCKRRRRLGEVEMRKEAIDRRQDGIDALALR